MTTVSEFDDDELNIIRFAVDFRWKTDDVELHLADVETKVTGEGNELAERPAVFWHAGNCNFVLIKLGARRYRGSFFYEPGEQFGTDVPYYDDINACVMSLLRLQADHASIRTGAYPANGSEKS